MDFSSYSINELVQLYSGTIKELKRRGVLRTKNVVGELGEYLVLECYHNNSELPDLSIVPVGTKNINAISQEGERYSIKSTTGTVTGVFYGLQPPESNVVDKPAFEYVIICKLNDECELEGIYQISWDVFIKHKKWHSRMNAWNLSLSKSLKDDSIIIFENKSVENTVPLESTKLCKEEEDPLYECNDINDRPPIIWEKGKVNHNAIRKSVANKLSKLFGEKFNQTSLSRFVSDDNEHALFIMSASYSQKNAEYWYSINDENLPWLSLFPRCHIAFALGSASAVLLFDLKQLSGLMNGCLKTKEDPDIKKKAHFHFSFAVDGNRVLFKQKVPEHSLIDISSALLKEDE